MNKRERGSEKVQGKEKARDGGRERECKRGWERERDGERERERERECVCVCEREAVIRLRVKV